MSAPLHPRGNADTCIKCKRKFMPGDRVQMVFIVRQVGMNPHNPREMGAWLGDEFEMAHETCEDPQLEGTMIIGSR
jgi:hypothetical protein